MRPKKLSVSVAVPPAPVRVPSQRPLAPSISSVKSDANDKGDNEMNKSSVLLSLAYVRDIAICSHKMVCFTENRKQTRELEM